jgi:signal transduction histidine kinase
VKGASYSTAPVITEVLLRVLQESLTNVIRHAHSRNIEVSLEVTEEYVDLHVADDGRGFDPREDSFGFGMNSMRQRLENVGGSLTVDSEPGLGTRVRAHIPRRGEE